MNKKLLRFAIPSALIAVVVVILVVRAGDPLKFIKPDPAFREYISGYTSGVVSSHGSIRVRLAHPYADSLMIGKKTDADLFRMEPGIEGGVRWIDSRTIEFRPTTPFKANTTYTCTFLLGSLKEVPEAFQKFVFQFHTIRQSYEITISAPELNNELDDFYTVKGTLITADVTTTDKVKEMIKADFAGKDPLIKWEESTSGTLFGFRIDSLKRADESVILTLSHNGKSIGVSGKGAEKVTIPGRKEFSVIDVTVVDLPEQHVMITFTDAVNTLTDFDGLVRIGYLRNLRFTADGNRLLVYPSYPSSEEMTLVIEESLKNIHGKPLGKSFSRSINFASKKPAVRMVNEGTIMPSSNGLHFPFEVVNLKAIDLKIQKIYEKNVPQFLQVNELAGTSEMFRVATTVYEGKVDLRQIANNVANYGQWQRYAIDLSEIMKPEKGAIYHVIINFKRAYSTYPCGTTGEVEEELTPLPAKAENPLEDQWDYSGIYDYDWYDYYDYDWKERENPCSDSYYYYRAVSGNIISSDIGLLAKAGSDGDLICYATDLITAQPLKGIKLHILDFQLQNIGEAISDEDGKVVFALKKKPFLLVGSRGDERAYLKLNDGNALSMSLFDVSGQTVQRGIKGFLYAERGVWRPGDTMHVHFMLEDKLKQLPADVPVIFELSDPRGVTIRRLVSNTSVKGIYPFPVSTEESAITGNYLGKVFIGNLTFSRYFKVEMVKPNRLKIDLRFPGDRMTGFDEHKGTLEVKWLHGANAPGLKAEVLMTLENGVTRFPGFDAYHFDDPTVGFESESTVVFEGNLDLNGKATIEPDIDTDDEIPGVLRATFMTKAFEAGGDFSVNTVTVPFYPYKRYAGLWVPKGSGWWDMIESGTQHTFKVANVSEGGKALSGGTLKVEVYRIDWRWWWQNNERGLPYFLSNTQAVPIHTANVKISDGRGQFVWGIDKSAWGRFLIRVTDPVSGHSTGKVVYMDQWGWSRRGGQSREGASMLTIATDKQHYAAGDQVHITIPSSLSGRALVSIESGSKVIRSEWIATDSGLTKFSFIAEPTMAPNVYVHITMLQPHRQTVNDMPIRMYGVVPVLIEDPNTRLAPVITTPSSWKSESEVSVTVSEKQGRPMAYTLAIVDEGLLDLTGFKTPDPWSKFYGKEALGVRTWDLYSEVIGATAGGFERLLSIGGGDTRVNHDKQKARRFPPVVKTFGPIYLEAGKRQTHKFKLPQYVGSVRVMVVAAHEGAYGNAEQTAEIKSPLMVLATLPRVAGPGETIDLPVNIFVMDKAIKNVQVTVTPSKLFETPDYGARSVTFKETGDKVINFRLKVKEEIGIARVEVLVTSGTNTARHTIDLEVRNPNPPGTTVYEVMIPPGDDMPLEFMVKGMKGSNTAEIEFSSIPPLNLARRLDDLITYPHGCLEQIVSGAFPQMVLKDLIYLDKRSLQQVNQHVTLVINKISQYALQDGSLAYWPGSRYNNSWSDIYSGHFLIEAEKRGFALPAGLKKRWITATKRTANQWQHTGIYRYDDFVQAYRLYVLALAGSPDIGSMNRLKNNTNITPQASWRLAAAYALAGKESIAKNIVQQVSRSIPEYQEYSYTFGNADRDRAMMLETMVLLNDMKSATLEASLLAETLASQRWLGTQTTAYSLIALAGYYGKVQTTGDIDATYQFNGKSFNVKTDKPIFKEELVGISSLKKGSVQVKNKTKGSLFVRIKVTGTPMAGEEKASSKKIALKTDYFWPDGTTLDPGKVTQGKDFVIQITVNNLTSDYVRELALTQILPSGWQIMNTRLTGFTDTRTGENAPFNYQDIRDDRILTYFNLAPKKSATFAMMVNATFAGTFYLPAFRCEAMYNNNVSAQTEGRWVEVTK